MALELVTIPCLQDNYTYLVHNSETGETAVVDVPEAAPVLAVLDARGWRLTDILLTHHHWDHIDGVADLLAATGAKVTGAKADRDRLPPLDRSVDDGENILVCGCPVKVLDVSGHTVGHIAYYFPTEKLAFTGDSLMAGGCGRLFEGSPQQMWQSLSKLAALPAETLICSGHEYTASNLRFALTLEPDNPDLILRQARVTEARNRSEPTVPSLLSEELATNPFLRAGLLRLKSAVGMENAADHESFAAIRARKDKF